MKKALVTGVEGQDGYYMAEYLKSLQEYEIVYAPRRSECDIATNSFDQLLVDLNPDEIYNFGGNSNNLEAFEDPYGLLNSNTIPVLKILGYQKNINNQSRFFQASSSLIFGNNCDEYGFQSIRTSKNPTTPYGASKLYGYNLIQTYKKHHKIYAVNGVLFNHESIRRKEYFIMPKIVKGLIEYKKSGDILEIGNINSMRDWSHAKDIVRGAYLSLQPELPNNYIFSSGKLKSIKYLLDYTADKLNINWEKAVEINPQFINKKQENNYPGDNMQSKNILKWCPEFTIEDILNELINYYEKLLAS